MADQLIGEILAVFEKVDGAAGQFGVVFEHVQPRRAGDGFFEKRFETLVVERNGGARDTASGDQLRERGRALIEIAAQIRGGKFGAGADRFGSFNGSAASIQVPRRESDAGTGTESCEWITRS